jgi:hypothetical protein
VSEQPYEIMWTEWHIELKCLWCGEYLGMLVQDEQHRNMHVVLPNRNIIQLHGAPLSRMRCGRCNGPVVPGESEHVHRREPTARMYEKEPGDIPHRGRPSKALLEQRRREKELEEIGA